MTKADAVIALQVRVAQMVVALRASRAFDITRALTLATIDWLRWMGASRVATEVPIEITTCGNTVKGALDVVGTWPNGAKLAIEIDRTMKERSLVKLEAAVGRGWKAVWVRWDPGAGAATCGAIAVVDVHRQATLLERSPRKAGRGKRRGQWAEAFAGGPPIGHKR